jgi:molybdate transport system ATP-binding protein
VADRRVTIKLRQDSPIPLDVDVACDPGDVLAIFGPSGSGKTTILRTIAGLYRPAQAVVRSGSITWTDTGNGVFVPPHQRAVGLVFQEYALFPHLSAAGNVMAALGHHPRSERRPRAEALLQRVHLSDRMTRRPSELSGGERQRVALARALAREPAVLLLDEPFAAVDRVVRRALQDEIHALRRTLDMPLILVTHDFEDVVRLATHVMMLERGRSLAVGTVTDLMSRPDLTWLRAAVGLGSVFTPSWRRPIQTAGSRSSPSKGGNCSSRTARSRWARPCACASPPARSSSRRAGRTASAFTTCCPARSLPLHPNPSDNQVVVQLAVGRVLLLAEVTARRRAAAGSGGRNRALRADQIGLG